MKPSLHRARRPRRAAWVDEGLGDWWRFALGSGSHVSFRWPGANVRSPMAAEYCRPRLARQLFKALLHPD